jgi:prevent-host-death family protein
MKTIEISEASRPLGEYARELSEDMIVVTSKQKPVAALVSLKHLDAESLALSTNAKFMEIIERSRAQFRSGQTWTLAQMKREFGRKASTKKRR